MICKTPDVWAHSAGGGRRRLETSAQPSRPARFISHLRSTIRTFALTGPESAYEFVVNRAAISCQGQHKSDKENRHAGVGNSHPQRSLSQRIRHQSQPQMHAPTVKNGCRCGTASAPRGSPVPLSSPRWAFFCRVILGHGTVPIAIEKFADTDKHGAFSPTF